MIHESPDWSLPPHITQQYHASPCNATPPPRILPNNVHIRDISKASYIRTLQSEVLLKSLDVYYFQTFDDWQMIHTDIYFIALHIFLFQIISAILCHVHTNKIPITREILFIYSIHTSTEWPFKSICDVLHFVAEYLHKPFNWWRGKMKNIFEGRRYFQIICERLLPWAPKFKVIKIISGI